MNPFDLQFWIIVVLFSTALFIGSKWLKKSLVDAVSQSVAGVVSDQWGQMFKKLDEYKTTVAAHDNDIEQLKKDCEELKGKAKLNRKDIEAILKKVQNLK